MKENKVNIFSRLIIKEKEPILFALFISIYLILQLFKFPDFRIDDFSNFWFGEATAKNISISGRVGYFYNGIFLFAAFLLGTFFLFRCLLNRFNPLKQRTNSLIYISGIGIILAISNVFGANSVNLSGIFLFLFGIQFIINLFGRGHKLISKLLISEVLFTLSVYAFLFYSGIQFLANPSGESISEAVLWFIVSFLFVSILFIQISRTKGSLKGLLALVPLVWVPTICFISAEIAIGIKYSGNPMMDYQILFFILFGITITLYYTIYRRRLFGMTFKAFTSRCLVIGVLTTLTVFTFYNPIVRYPVELFESANIANAQMRLFEFGEIPFVDFMTSHMMYEQWTGWIYNLINGYKNDFSFMAYFFLNQLIFLILLFFILKEVIGDVVQSLLLIICLPFIGDLFNPALLLGVLPIFYIHKLMKEASVINYLKLFWVVIFMVFWKLDTGFACIVASVMGLLILWISKNIQFEIKKVLISLGITLGILVLGFAITFMLRSPDYVIDNMIASLHYFKAGQAHGLSKLSIVTDQKFYIHYFLLPLISVILVIFSIIELGLKEHKSKIPFTHLTGLFFILFFLGNFQRGLVRHSFMENLDMYWSSFFFTGLVFYFVHWYGSSNRSEIFRILFLGNFALFLLIKPFPISERNMILETALSQPTYMGFKSHLVSSEFDSRVEISPELQKEYIPIVKYLKQELRDDETFFDFSNTPLLYYLTEKSQPSYFCQNLQNTVGDYLQLKQIDQLKESNTPILVYANEPLTFWDHTDGVDNTLRYYLIAEYLFQNFQPDTIIGNKWVWKRVAMVKKLSQLDPKTFRSIDYGQAAGVLNKYLENNWGLIEEIQYLQFDNFEDGKWYEIDFPKDLCGLKAAFLELEFEQLSEMYSGEFIDWIIHLSSGEQLAGAARVEAFDNHLKYTIRLTNFYNWYHSEIDKIKIYPNDLAKQRMRLKSIKVLKDTRIES